MFGGLGFWWGAGEHERELVGLLVGFALVCRRRLPQGSFASLGRRGLVCRFGGAAFLALWSKALNFSWGFEV